MCTAIGLNKSLRYREKCARGQFRNRNSLQEAMSYPYQLNAYANKADLLHEHKGKKLSELHQVFSSGSVGMEVV